MYEEMYKKLEEELKECREKKRASLSTVAIMEKEIEMLEELIAPFKRYFGQGDTDTNAGFIAGESTINLRTQ